LAAASEAALVDAAEGCRNQATFPVSTRTSSPVSVESKIRSMVSLPVNCAANWRFLGSAAVCGVEFSTL
jgi:hypothetical protein